MNIDVEASAKDLNKPKIEQTNTQGRTDVVDNEDKVGNDNEKSSKPRINPQKSFTVTVSPDKPTYSQGEIVYLSGSIIDSGKIPPTNGTISIQVLDPNGSTIMASFTIPLADRESGACLSRPPPTAVRATVGRYPCEK